MQSHYSNEVNSTFEPSDDSRYDIHRSQASAHSRSPSLVLQAAEQLIQSMESMSGRREASREQLLLCQPRSNSSHTHQQRSTSHGMTFYEDKTFVPNLDFSRASKIGNSNRTSVAGSPKSTPQESSPQRKHLRSLQNGAARNTSSQHESKKYPSRILSGSFCGTTVSFDFILVVLTGIVTCSMVQLAGFRNYFGRCRSSKYLERNRQIVQT